MNYDLDTKEGMTNAMRWTQMLVDQLREHGVWVIPRSNTTVTVNKPSNTVTLDGDHPERGVERIFKALGWTVITKGESK
jgi:hypothetical protein